MKRLFACLFILFLIVSLSFSQKKSNCILWQLPDRNLISDKKESQQNSYVFLMSNGKVVVMDGGVKDEALYLRGFLGALGNEVEAWFISHLHSDHVGALNEILKKPGNIRIKKIYHSEFPKQYYENTGTAKALTTDSVEMEFYTNLKKSGIEVINFTKPGEIIQIDKTKFKILSVTNPDITQRNFGNNNSMVIKVWDQKKSFLFLGDLYEDGGDELLNGPFRGDLNCDYIQMAHHGQNGVKLDFYRNIKFKACLWPAPLWLYNNDVGNGFDTHHYKTIKTRNLMDELGIKEHYVSGKGLVKIE